MLVVLATTAVNFVASANDFSKLSTTVVNYLTYSIDLTGTAVRNISKVKVDCRNYTIQSDTQFLDTLSSSTFTNCVFSLYKTFAKNVVEVEFTNVTMVYTAETIAPIISNQLYKSLFVGFSLLANDAIAYWSSDNRFIGVHVYNYLDQDGDIAGMADDSQNDVFVNCYFDIEMHARVVFSVGGLFQNSLNLSISDSRVWVNISQDRSSKTYIGGISAISRPIQIDRVDAVVTLLMGEMDGYIGGLIGTQLHPNAHMYNVSVTITMKLNTTDSSSDLYAIGGLLGRSTRENASYARITIYANIVINSTQPMRCLVSGAFGDIENGTMTTIKNIYVFGIFDLFGQQNLAFGGVAGELGLAQLSDSVFNGDIKAIAGGNSTIAGMVALSLPDSFLWRCSAHGSMDVTIRMTGYGEFLVGGVIAMAWGSRVNLTYSNQVISVHGDVISSASTLYIGLLAANVNRSASVVYSFANGSLSCNLNQISSVSGFIGLLAGMCDYSNITQSFATADLYIDAAGMNYIMAGSISGCIQYATITDVFVIGNMSIYASINVGSIFGGMQTRNEVRGISIVVQISSYNAIGDIYMRRNATGFESDKIAIDCELGNHDSYSDACQTDAQMKNQSLLQRLGSQFRMNATQNLGYAFLVENAIPTFPGFALQGAGFSPFNYYIDTQGLPFLNASMNLCVGACYGDYKSPVVFTCSKSPTNSSGRFCTDLYRAAEEFPNQSCMTLNAYCDNGRSTCNSDSELVDRQCISHCSRCVFGHCSNSVCICDPYYSGSDCSTKTCDAMTPVCFGYSHMTCAKNNIDCICDDPAYYQTWQGCFEGCPGLIATHGTCIGDHKAECINFWTSVNGGLCNKCDEGYVERDDICVDEDSTCYEGRCVHGTCIEKPSATCNCSALWSGTRCDSCAAYGSNCDMNQEQCDALCNAHGMCQTIYTDKCTCFANFAGERCTECAAGYFLTECITPSQCGVSKCTSHGSCYGSATNPTCLCVNLWKGTSCSTCSDFGMNCELSKDYCREQYCLDCDNKDHCGCVGTYQYPQCECVDGWYGKRCSDSQEYCDSTVCGGHGKCRGGISYSCTCDVFWLGDRCQTCYGYGPSCNMSKLKCQEALCDNGGECQGFGEDTKCVCFEHFDSATNCTSCVSGYTRDGLNCVPKGINVWAIVVGVCGVLLLIAVILGITYYFVRKHKIKIAYARIAEGDKAYKQTNADTEF